MGPPARRARVLVLAHSGTLSASVSAAATLQPGSEIDVLPLGRAAAEAPVPVGVGRVLLPQLGVGAVTDVRRVARLIRRLRRRHYQRAVIALPELGVNQSRGALLGIALAS